jgi:hypothetical protein
VLELALAQVGARREDLESLARAQSFCLLIGAGLIVVGVLGFVFAAPAST